MHCPQKTDFLKINHVNFIKLLQKSRQKCKKRSLVPSFISQICVTWFTWSLKHYCMFYRCCFTISKSKGIFLTFDLFGGRTLHNNKRGVEPCVALRVSCVSRKQFCADLKQFIEYYKD